MGNGKGVTVARKAEKAGVPKVKAPKERTFSEAEKEIEIFDNTIDKGYVDDDNILRPKKTQKTCEIEVEGKKKEDVLVLGRGPKARIEELAEKEIGHTSTVQSSVPKDIFKKNYSDIRKADKIVQYMDDIPTTLDEAVETGGGQYSRAEAYMINQRKDLLEKTIRKFER